MEQPEPLEDILADVLDGALSGVHTALPGRVERYYPSDQTADVLPLVKAIRTTEDGRSLSDSNPVLPRVPVIHPRGGGFFVHLPLEAGDFVMLVFQEAAIDQWRARDGRESHPGDVRRHALGNAVAYPGLYPTSRSVTLTSTANLVLGAETGQQIHIQPGGSGQIRLGAAGETSLVALAELVAAELTRVNADLTVLKAAVVAGFNALLAPAGGAGGASAFTGASATVPSSPGSVAATRTTAL